MVKEKGIKPGILSTELWLPALGVYAVLEVANSSEDWRLKLATIIGISVVSVAYIIARTWYKGKAQNEAIHNDRGTVDHRFAPASSYLLSDEPEDRED